MTRRFHSYTYHDECSDGVDLVIENENDHNIIIL